ncbi:MAG: hypothetical protein FJ009_16545 [Chloroflexi bacterium]|nr:hypothetical protein [Chloroflexota bacterium]
MSHGGCKYFLVGAGIAGLIASLLAIVALGIYLVLNPASLMTQQLPPPVPGPDVAFQEPAPGARLAVGEAVLVFATARDASRVTRVDLWVDDQLVIQQTAPDPNGVTPFSLIHNLIASKPGTYALTARAYNGLGAMGESPRVFVTVIDSPRYGGGHRQAGGRDRTNHPGHESRYGRCPQPRRCDRCPGA